MSSESFNPPAGELPPLGPASKPVANKSVVPWAVAGSIGIAAFAIWMSMHSTILAKDAVIREKEAQIATLRDQQSKTVEEANRRLKSLAEEADSRVRSLADQATQKLQVANQPEVPVQVGFRKALVHAGNVLLLRTTAGSAIAVLAEIERPGTSTSRSYQITLDPGRVRELGEREGWAFVSGDTIRISHPEHKSLKFIAP